MRSAGARSPQADPGIAAGGAPHVRRGELAATFLLAAAIALAEADVVRLDVLGWRDDTETGVLWAVLPLLSACWWICERNQLGRTQPGVLGLAWAIWMTVSALVSERPLESFVVATGAITTAALAHRLTETRRQGDFLVLVVLAGGFAWMGAVVATSLGWTEFGHRGRVALWWLEANQLAVASVVVALGALAMATDGAARRSASLAVSAPLLSRAGPWLLIFTTGLAATAATTSRTAAAALAVGTLVTIRTRLGLSGRFIVSGAAAGVAIVALGLTAGLGPADLLSREGQPGDNDFTSGNGRTEVWRSFAADTDAWAISGVGPGNDAEFTAERRVAGDLGFDADHAHGLVGHVLLTTGPPGVVILGVIAAIVLTSMRRQTPGIQGLTVALIVLSFAEPLVRTPGVAFAALVGLASICGPGDPHRA